MKVLLHKKEFSTDSVDEIQLDYFPLCEIFESRVLKSYYIKSLGLLEIEYIWVKCLFDYNLRQSSKFDNDIQLNKKNMAILDVSLSQMESKFSSLT